MNKFSDLNIETRKDYFSGDKIKILKILNKEIIVHNYKLNDSRFKNSNSDKCLYIQIEKDGERFVLFTGSKILADAIKQVQKESFPFTTTITKEGEAFQFN